ncbi:MAG: VanZ family protein [Anaerolineaceae bacterium]|nr:VanZ family protein [Anaerolineaceae bacterium]
MAGVSSRYPAIQLWFDRIFAEEWMHIISHILLYTVLALILIWLLDYTGMQILWVFPIVLIVGVIQEVIQASIAGISFGWMSVFDLSVDLAGGLLGSVLMGFRRRKPVQARTKYSQK